MRVRALRGVCVGPRRHLKAGEFATDLDPATISFLVSIKAVVEDEAPAQAAPVIAPAPAAADQKDDPKANRKEK